MNRLIKELEELIGRDSQVRTVRLYGGLGIAYSGNSKEGTLSLSRLESGGVFPSDNEIKIIKRDFVKAAAEYGLRVQSIKEVDRVSLTTKNKHLVVRLKVCFSGQIEMQL